MILAYLNLISKMQKCICYVHHLEGMKNEMNEALMKGLRLTLTSMFGIQSRPIKD